MWPTMVHVSLVERPSDLHRATVKTSQAAVTDIRISTPSLYIRRSFSFLLQ